MKTLIIVSSFYLGNTMKVAESMAEELKADIKTPREIIPEMISAYDLIGFGSGINFASHNKEIISVLEKISINEKKIFIFSTRCRPILGGYHRKLKSLIRVKNGILLGEFSCVGFDRTGPWVGIDGYNKNRPDDKDLCKAKLFAAKMRKKAHPLANFNKSHPAFPGSDGVSFRTDGINKVLGDIVLINTTACISCFKCIKSCPLNVFSLQENKTILPSGEINCIMCGICEKGCPANAIYINESFRNGLRIMVRESTCDKLQKAYWSE